MLDVTRGRTISHRLGLALAVVLIALTPLWLCLLMARQQAAAVQRDKALFYAADVIHRAEGTGGQIERGFRALTSLKEDQRCAALGLAEMARIDAISSDVQFFGVVRGDRLICSSYGRHAAIALGPPDFTAATGYSFRREIHLPFANGAPLAMFDRRGFAAVVHRSSAVDITLDRPDIALAVIAFSRDLELARRGTFPSSWKGGRARLARGGVRTTPVDGHVVAQHRSAVFPNLVAVASVGPSTYTEAFDQALRASAPIALAAAGLLGWLVSWIGRSRTSPAAAIRAALRNHEFHVVYQPIVSLADGRWVGAEALLRWRRSNGRVVPPDVFVPIAEDSGLICRLTARAVELVEPTLRSLCATPGFFISINLSSDDLKTEDTVAALQRMLARSGIAPRCVHLEITERGFADTDAARAQVRHLRSLGFHISIDDFGTGYSSLAELLRLELDTLKIDKTFVEAIGSGAATSQVAFHIVEMARGLSLTTIAEGIETEAQAAALRDWRVDYGQGWLYSKPLSADDLLDQLRARASVSPGHNNAI